MFACLILPFLPEPGVYLRSSFHPSFEAARRNAEQNDGVVAIQDVETDKIVWKREETAKDEETRRDHP